jgi:ketosteroid isomerase-like protein
MGDLQMLPLHTKVTWTGRGDMIPIEHREARVEGRSDPTPPTNLSMGASSGPRALWAGLSGRVVGGRWDGVTMTTTTPHPAVGAGTPEALEARFVELASAGDLDGIVGLYAADAVVSLPRGREAAGHAAIRVAFATALAAGALGPFDEAVVSRAVVTGDLAMTTSSAPDGAVHTQVARRTADGRWVWVRDGSRLRGVPACLPVEPGSLAVA